MGHGEGPENWAMGRKIKEGMEVSGMKSNMVLGAIFWMCKNTVGKENRGTIQILSYLDTRS